MNRIITLFAASTLVLALCLGCASQKATPKVNPDQSAAGLFETINLSDKDNGGKVQMKIGQNLVISLKANPSTGYRWEMADLDETILPLLTRDYKQREAEPGMVGVGGIVTLSFKAIAAGQANIKLIYTRPQSGEDDIADTFSVMVDVK